MENRIRVLISSVRKLLKREAWRNIQRILAKTHIADIALVIEGLEGDERLQLFKLELSIERRAEIFSYLDRRIQLALLAGLPKPEVNQLVHLMESDDAADLLRDLQEDLSKEILDSMVKEDKEEVADLMRYPEDSAGGLMRSDMIAFDESMTVGEAIAKIQNQDDDSSLIAFYVYVTDEAQKLVGVVSLKGLLLSKPGEKLKDIMSTDVINVRVETDQQEVARTVERYDFLAVPVVDETNTLMGVITVDDVIDVIREEAQEDLLAIGQVGESDDFSVRGHLRARLPSLVLIFMGGVICYVIVYRLLSIASSAMSPLLVNISAMAPLVLSLSESSGGQAATIALGTIRSGKIDLNTLGFHIWHELKVNMILGALFGMLVIILAIVVTHNFSMSVLMGLIVYIQVLIAASFGNLIPILLEKMQVDPAARTISVLTAASNISSTLLLYGLAVNLFAS